MTLSLHSYDTHWPLNVPELKTPTFAALEIELPDECPDGATDSDTSSRKSDSGMDLGMHDSDLQPVLDNLDNLDDVCGESAIVPPAIPDQSMFAYDILTTMPARYPDLGPKPTMIPKDTPDLLWPATSHPQIAPAEYATWIKTHDHIQPNTTKVQRQKSKLSASYRPQLKESSLTPESAGAVKAHRPTSELTDWRPTVSEIDSAENPPKNTCEEDLSRLHTAHIHPNARPALHRPVSAPPLSNPSSIPSTPASLTESAPTAPKIRRSLSERFSSSTQKTVSGIQWLKNIFSARKKIQSNQSIQSNQTENTEVTQKQGKKRGGLAAFFFPLVRKPSVQIEPSSTSCKMPVFTTGSRLATHVEHAIYHLSNRKLNSTNPRRSLHDQVLITNFMFWYRSVNRANVRSKYTNHQAMLYSRRRASAADVPPHHRPCATQPSRRKNDRYKPVPNIQYTKPIAPSPRKIPTRTKLSNDYGDYIINGEEDVLDIYYKNRISR